MVYMQGAVSWDDYERMPVSVVIPAQLDEFSYRRVF